MVFAQFQLIFPQSFLKPFQGELALARGRVSDGQVMHAQQGLRIICPQDPGPAFKRFLQHRHGLIRFAAL